MINFIVVIISVFAIGFLVLWILQPSFRTWVERPKYMVLENDQRLNETKQKPSRSSPRSRGREDRN
jgi:hypothetical protein